MPSYDCYLNGASPACGLVVSVRQLAVLPQANEKLGSLRDTFTDRESTIRQLKRDNALMKKKVKQCQEELDNLRKVSVLFYSSLAGH